ncbi:MAG: SOS response-associated peptidase [Gemmatimonadota bacterium]|nr:SOS response-associated peptidase [Gemmatimonadota bacterium]
MCGRFTLATPAAEWAALFELGDVPEFAPRWNIAPTQDVAAVRVVPRADGGADPAEREVARLRWGLVPHWAKEVDPLGRALINARSETAAEKPSFRDPFRARRCLVVADGFYEWGPGTGGRKQPYWIGLAGGGPFGFAGLWDRWEVEPGTVLETCAILTTGANEALRPLHDRMPVILPPAEHRTWLDPAAETGVLEEALRPLPPDAVTFHPVSTRVNHVGNDDPECAAPLRTQRELFR